MSAADQHRSATLELWPFLVTRGRRTPFCAVVVPGLALDDGPSFGTLLLDAAGGEPTDEGELLYREILRPAPVADQPPPPPLALLYRVVKANAADIQGAAGAALRDEHSRPVPLIEGVARVLPAGAASGAPGSVWLPRGAMRDVHAYNSRAFRDFWRTDDPAFRAVRSEALRYPPTAPAEAAAWSVLPSFQLRAKRRRPGPAAGEATGKALAPAADDGGEGEDTGGTPDAAAADGDTADDGRSRRDALAHRLRGIIGRLLNENRRPR